MATRGADLRGGGAWLSVRIKSMAARLLSRRWTLSPWWPGEGSAARQQTLLQMLAAGVRERANLGRLTAALADEHAWLYRRRLQRLAARLGSGTPLADAVEQTPGALSPTGVLAARFGTQSGTLAAALDEFAWQDKRPMLAVRRRIRAALLYLAGMILAVTVVMMFLLVRIVPSYVEIFHDFDLQLPKLSIDLIRLGHFVETAVVPTLILLAGAGAVWLIASRSRWRRRPLSRMAVGVVRPAASLEVSKLWNLLATAADGGRPLPGAISTLARYHYDPAIRRKLLYVRNELDHGAELFESLAGVGLATPAEVEALQRAPVDEGPGWTLRQLAEARRRRVFSRVDALLDFVFPAIVIVLGVFVAFVAAAMLSPLTSMTEALG